MFHHIEKHKRERFGAHSYAFGGDKEQNTSTSNRVTDASNTTTSSTNINDLSNRSYKDAFNTTSNSNNTQASFWTDSSTQANNSNNTTSNFSTTSIDTGTRITNTLDGGAISGIAGVAMDAGKNALDQVKQAFGLASTVVGAAGAAQVHAYDFADGLFHASQEAVTAADTRAYNAWDRAARMQEGAASEIQNAYADAKGTTQSNQKLMLAVVAVAGVAVLAAARKG